MPDDSQSKAEVARNRFYPLRPLTNEELDAVVKELKVAVRQDFYERRDRQKKRQSVSAAQ